MQANGGLRMPFQDVVQPLRAVIKYIERILLYRIICIIYSG